MRQILKEMNPDCTFQIREVESSDASGIADIYNHYISHSTATFDTRDVSSKEMEDRILSIKGKFPFIVMIANGSVVAFCYAHPWKTKAAYARTLETTIYINPDFCGLGIGERLMNRLIEDCKDAGFLVLIACITSENEGSIRFHEKLGFEKVSCFKGVGEKFGRLLDVTDLELTLR